MDAWNVASFDTNTKKGTNNIERLIVSTDIPQNKGCGMLAWLGTKAVNLRALSLVGMTIPTVPVLSMQRERRVRSKGIHFAFERAKVSLEA